MSGSVGYDHGAPAAGAIVSATSLATATHSGVAVADAAGAFHLALPPGEYALTVAANQGSALLEKHSAPDLDLRIKLSRACHVLRGCTRRHGPATQVRAERWSTADGEVYYGATDPRGCFTLCVPDGYYMVSLGGDVVSQPLDVHVAATTELQLDGFLASAVKNPPPKVSQISADLTGLIADIKSRDPVIIGMGEATHGTREFTTLRGELSLALVRQADVQLLLFEIDAISATALDDYVNGGDVDIARAVVALGFWVTDTYEFLHFLELVRTYNAGSTRKVHIWGVDVQNTQLPVTTITDHVTHLTDDEAAALAAAATRRGKAVHDLPAPQRAALAALLSRLGTPHGSSRDDLLLAVAARSLALQLHYLDGDTLGQYRRRRDAGMAELATFITTQMRVRRACLWAHDGHITKDGDSPMLGRNLAQNPVLRYYGIGFYLYEGSARAWDGGAKIGVIPNTISAAAPYMVEGAIMRATGMPAVAWLPLDKLPRALSDWLDTPRLVREVGATYVDDQVETLRRIREAFDAIVVIRTGHDSTPTATGVRTAKHD
ncbi:MAG TPA: erythromycin esterase family protein [Burkholderiaceae bacterium]|nr:erythromycin esterase family protein [Burkholderiaceae bacterium]